MEEIREAWKGIGVFVSAIAAFFVLGIPFVDHEARIMLVISASGLLGLAVFALQKSRRSVP